MKNIIYFFLLLFIVLASCEKFDEVHQEYIEGGEITYSIKPESIQVIAGLNRCVVTAQVAVTPNIDKFVVEWEDQKIETPLSSNVDTAEVEAEITNVKEGAVIFNVTTTGLQGNISVPSNAFGTVYGDKYQKNLLHRGIVEINGIEEGALVKFSTSPENSVGVTLNYTDQDGILQTINVLPDDKEVILTNCEYGSVLEYLTYYLPEENCLDTIPTHETAKKIIPEPELVEKVIAIDPSNIMELDNDIKKPVWETKYSNLFDGEYTTYTAFDYSSSVSTLTFDLGKVLEFTKLKMWFRLNGAGHYYGGSNAKTIEIYGAAELPASTDLSEWDLLSTHTFTKPSGGEDLTNEDKATAEAGFDCLVESKPKIRYVRIKAVENYAENGNKILL